MGANESDLETESTFDNNFRLDTQNDENVDFKYLGLVEENGTVLRHFQKSYKNPEKTSDETVRSTTDYWDDASTLQPKRMVNGGEIIIFESIDAISDFEVESEVQKLGGLGCKNN